MRSSDEHRSRVSDYKTDPMGSGQRTRQIEQDIDRTRAQMDGTIDELSDRLRPWNLLGDALAWMGIRREGRTVASAAGSAVADVARDAAAAAIRTGAGAVASTCRKHPLPSALIGVGVAWMIREQFAPAAQRWGNRSRSGADETRYEDETAAYEAGREGVMTRARHAAESAGQRVRESVSQAGHRVAERVTDAGHRVAEGAREAGRRIRQTAQDAAGRTGEGLAHAAQQVRQGARYAGSQAMHGVEYAGEQLREGYHTTRHQAARAVEEHPIGVAAGTLAAGVLLGLLMPHTRREDRWMGEQSDRIYRAAEDAARDAANRVKTVAGTAMDAARDEAERQGLAPERSDDDAGSTSESGGASAGAWAASARSGQAADSGAPRGA